METDGVVSSVSGPHGAGSSGVGSSVSGTHGTGFSGRMKTRSRSRIEEFPSSPIPQLDGEHTPLEPLDSEEGEDYIGWNYPGPRRGRIVQLKQDLQRIWPDCETFNLSFSDGNSLNEIILGCSCLEP